jgi:23S rRNA-/tRNA-specific pseudouridylate synthase
LTNKNPASKKEHNKERDTVTTISIDTFQSRIISEDDDRLVINKPAGISIHPSQSTEKSQQPQSIHDLIKQYYSSR